MSDEEATPGDEDELDYDEYEFPCPSQAILPAPVSSLRSHSSIHIPVPVAINKPDMSSFLSSSLTELPSFTPSANPKQYLKKPSSPTQPRHVTRKKSLADFLELQHFRSRKKKSQERPDKLSRSTSESHEQLTKYLERIFAENNSLLLRTLLQQPVTTTNRDQREQLLNLVINFLRASPPEVFISVTDLLKEVVLDENVKGFSVAEFKAFSAQETASIVKYSSLSSDWTQLRWWHVAQQMLSISLSGSSCIEEAWENLHDKLSKNSKYLPKRHKIFPLFHSFVSEVTLNGIDGISNEARNILCDLKRIIENICAFSATRALKRVFVYSLSHYLCTKGKKLSEGPIKSAIEKGSKLLQQSLLCDDFGFENDIEKTTTTKTLGLLDKFFTVVANPFNKTIEQDNTSVDQTEYALCFDSLYKYILDDLDNVWDVAITIGPNISNLFLAFSVIGLAQTVQDLDETLLALQPRSPKKY